MKYQVILTPEAVEMLEAISDRRVQQLIAQRITKLIESPEQQGKALLGPLKGYYSVRAASQRFRIIYRIDHDIVVVTVVAIGIRKDGDRSKDAYAIAKKLLKTGLLELP